MGLEVVAPGHPERRRLERFIADAYHSAYGARIEHYAEVLVALRSGASDWAAAVGYTLAGKGRLFLEQYLDRPIEEEVKGRIGGSAGREQFVEVGNLAANGAGAARVVIVRMAALLYALNRTWAVFTSTRALVNSFARLDIAPITIASADPARLPDGGSSWGSYYASQPAVLAACIPLGYRHLGRAPNPARRAGIP
jgi:hypothetical protein